MSTLQPVAAPTKQSIEQTPPSKLTRFTQIACCATSAAVIVAEVIRQINREVEIIPFANKYLPAPTTNLMIASTAMVIFLGTFMLRRESAAQPKVQDAPMVEEPQSPFVTKSKEEVNDIFLTACSYLSFFERFMELQPPVIHAFGPNFNKEKELINFLKNFKNELRSFDKNKNEVSINRESIERLTRIQSEYVLVAVCNLNGLKQRIFEYTKKNKYTLGEKMNAFVNLESKLEKMENDFRYEGTIVLTRAEADLIESIPN